MKQDLPAGRQAWRERSSFSFPAKEKKIYLLQLIKRSASLKLDMNPAQDYRPILTEVIQKQIALLGPQITLQRARSVVGLTVLDDGTVSALEGNPKLLMRSLIDQFVQLSGLIVKKTMEPLFDVVPGTNISDPRRSPQAEIDQALKGATFL